MERRRFDHLMLEISLALNRNLPRYPVWLAFKEMGAEPDLPTREQVVAFCEGSLAALLAQLGHALTPRQQRRLVRAVARFDPALRTPYEHMERFGSSTGSRD